MEIKSFVDREDGGADISMELTPEEHTAMLQLGIMTAIEMGIEKLGDQPEQGEAE